MLEKRIKTLEDEIRRLKEEVKGLKNRVGEAGEILRRLGFPIQDDYETILEGVDWDRVIYEMAVNRDMALLEAWKKSGRPITGAKKP